MVHQDSSRLILFLAITTFILVLYSTFLTRSGILGDASVHSFVSPGMAVYLFLVLFIGTFIVIGVGAISLRWKYLEMHEQPNDNFWSRELALFTGSIVLISIRNNYSCGNFGTYFRYIR